MSNTPQLLSLFFPLTVSQFIAWSAFTVLTLNPASALFAAVSTGQMAIWAIKKHKAYKKEFGTEYPRGRRAMFPFVF